MTAHALDGGFADPARDAAFAFRAVMTAMSRPGEIATVNGAFGPAPMSPAAAATLLTLCDMDTGLHLAGEHDCEPVRGWVAFHTGAPVTDKAKASFALGSWQDLLPLADYPVGTAEYPDRSTTLIVECSQLSTAGATLKGPGIESTATLSLPEIQGFVANHRLFPLGLDFIFTCGDRLASLPRSTEVSECM